ncbi:FecR family protein [Larkinella insperata]|uniref:FecR family protein n=1 Tax=Larkinella insperata TaxID=332158 RepID=A0ABW3Q6D6_9BACT|nr:FecR domain-containing protein [Larkinella insperata]
MKYNHYKAGDFAAEESFIAWVRQSDPDHQAFWESWVNEHPEKAGEVALARQLLSLWQITQPAPAPDAMTEVWQAIQGGCQETVREAVALGRRTFWQSYGRWAAVFLGTLLVVATAVWLVDALQTTRYATAEGETRTVQLPDGSTVVLNANSAISFAKQWPPDQPREIALKGQAFFSVRHLTSHQKFVVQTSDGVRVEVLGTTFTVAREKTKTRVVLNTGKVGLYVKNRTQPLLMKPGEMVEVSKDEQRKIVRRQVRPEVYSAWKDHQFIFDNTSLEEIADLIESNFGYSVEFSDPVLKKNTMTIKALNRDLDLLLNVLAETHDLKITRQKNRILLSPKPLP